MMQRINIVATLVLMLTLIAGCDLLFNISPKCNNPAQLLGELDSEAPGFIIMFKDDVDTIGEVNRLSAYYNMLTQHVYTAKGIEGFTAQISDEILDRLRCEPTIDFIEHDAVTYPANDAE